ncbi:MAG: hypothetical protein H7838_00750 [Magnetococcus sp. DMHC-8]
MFHIIPLTVINQGFWRLNRLLLPVVLCLVVFVGIMGGGAPHSPGLVASMAMVAALAWLLPAFLVCFHVLVAKLFDGLLRRVPWSRAEVSWPGLLLAAVLVVILGNVWVDDLYQFHRGDYTLSAVALCLDVGGMVAVVMAGGGQRGR